MSEPALSSRQPRGLVVRAGGVDDATNGRRQGWGHVVVGCVVVLVGYLDCENIMSTKTLPCSLVTNAMPGL